MSEVILGILLIAFVLFVLDNFAELIFVVLCFLGIGTVLFTVSKDVGHFVIGLSK